MRGVVAHSNCDMVPVAYIERRMPVTAAAHPVSHDRRQACDRTGIPHRQSRNIDFVRGQAQLRIQLVFHFDQQVEKLGIARRRHVGFALAGAS